MSPRRFLTKSRFKLACECPTKLYYTGKSEYANQSLDDSFLQALAEGGFQVGELAKAYFSSGHDITTLDYKESLEQTNELMKLDEVVIFEAAIAYENLFIRADVLHKSGNRIFLYEVKAKSINLSKGDPFHGRGGVIKSAWKPYLYDVAFQKYVIQKAFPSCSVSSHLMLANKEAKAPSDGLNQKFILQNNSDGRKEAVQTTPLTDVELASEILVKINVDRECEQIYEGTDSKELPSVSFTGKIELYADYYERDIRIPTPISTACGSCEFKTKPADVIAGKLDGKKECWKACLGWSDSDFADATVFDIWNFRKKAKLIPQGILKMDEITEDTISPIHDGKPGISASERQWLQVEKYTTQDSSIWLDKAGMKAEMDSWTYPLHFIDFETSTVAIPFTKGMHPYESMAFQFSHHVVNSNGSIEHRSEYLKVDSTC